MTGTAIKKENSVATKREQESSIAPRIVEPEREVPGMIASNCKKPMHSAVRQLSCSKERMRGFAVRLRRSSRMNRMP